MNRFMVFFVFLMFSAVSALATHVAVLETVARIMCRFRIVSI